MFKSFFSALLVAALFAGAAEAASMEKRTEKSVAMAAESFVATLEKKGATVFAVIDHAAGAEKAGIALAPSILVIFGNPKIGAPMMQAAPEMGVALPMKALFLDDGAGGARILYTDIEAVATRHGLDPAHAAVQKARKALDGLTGAVAQ